MKLSVLIVDDSSVVRAMIKKAIIMSGAEIHDVFHAANGVEALQVLDRHWVDVVFVDLNMPVMGGAELVQRMSQDAVLVAIPVVVVSADQNPETIERLRRQGVRAYVQKPFRPEMLRDVIRQLSM